MEMYTNFTLKFSISKGNYDYQQIVDILSHMTDISVALTCDTPDHPFFSSPRWRVMAAGCKGHIDEYNGFCRSGADVSLNGDFKNYGGEIGLFIDWIAPHLSMDLVGYSRYEGHGFVLPHFVMAP